MDTNFVNFSIKNKMDMIQSMMDCLYAKCIPYITDCVMAELEKLGAKYRIALRIVKDPRFERLPCIHAGTYADDCLVNRWTMDQISVPDPWNFGVDPDPDPAIFVIDLQDASKKLIF